MFARDLSLENLSLSIDCWKIWANTGPTCNSVADSFRSLGWSSSGPKTCEGFGEDVFCRKQNCHSIGTLAMNITLQFLQSD